MFRAGTMLFLLSGSLLAQEPLPRVTEAPWPEVRKQSRLLVTLLKKERVLVPEVERDLLRLLNTESLAAEDALKQLQDLLDPFCLVGVTINPESRVKAARGGAEATLIVDKPRVFLVKVHNEGGITPPLSLTGEEIRIPNKKEASRWLDAVILTPQKKTLSGVRLEYVLLKLTASESGKREATFKFDAGQGTQDLGFRAELPILFRIHLR